MSLPDVREYGDRHGESMLRYALSRFLPGSFGGDAAEMSAMDCFVAVIRHICSMLDREMTNRVATDETLGFIMSDYSADTDEDQKRVQQYKTATLKSVRELVGKDNPTFEDIVECEQVRDKFWSLDGLRLFLCPLYRHTLEQPWETRGSFMLETERSLVKWRLQDFGRMEDVLTKTKFGVAQFSNGGEMLFVFGSPAVVRVRLESKVNRETWQGGNFSIRDVQSFSFDSVTRRTIRNMKKDTTIVSDVPGGPEERVLYCLIAVVRLRNTDEDRDYARLYDIESQNVIPHGNPDHFDTFNNELWSLGSLDHDYMLYYIRADDRPAGLVRRGMEFGDQDPDHECVIKDERLTDGAWQAARTLRMIPESLGLVNKDDIHAS